MPKPAINKTTTTTVTTRSERPPTRTSRDTTPRRTRNSRTTTSDVQLSIDGFDVVALVDTGADYSVMSGSFASKLRKVTTSWDGPHIRTAGGHLVTPSGTCTSRVTINGTTYPAAFVILPKCSRDVILGMDFLTDNGAIIDLQAKSISFSADHAMSPKPTYEKRGTLRIADDHVTLPPRASLMIAVNCQEAVPDTDALVESDQSLLLERGVSSQEALCA